MTTITRTANPPKPTIRGLNSAALAAYARRAVWRANLAVLVYAALGMLAGYTTVLLYNSYALLVGLVAAYGLRLPPLPIIPYLEYILPLGLGLLFALVAANRAEEARFKSQLALHILRVQELLERDKE